MQKITPFLWFDGEAEAAARLYVSLFENSRIITVVPYGEGGPGKPGTAMTVDFELAGQRFTALNGGPHFKFTPAVSFYINCGTQEEVDRFWTALLAGGGREDQCGWLQDRFGLSWQVVPEALPHYLQDPDPKKSQRVMAAMMKMRKIVIADLDKAYAG
jgi:predicted 3-demethylubiquinone-9 3-methyltransferase (glyoxalase superfamily)